MCEEYAEQPTEPRDLSLAAPQGPLRLTQSQPGPGPWREPHAASRRRPSRAHLSRPAHPWLAHCWKSICSQCRPLATLASQHLRVKVVSQPLEQRRRALDIGEQEGEGLHGLSVKGRIRRCHRHQAHPQADPLTPPIASGGRLAGHRSPARACPDSLVPAPAEQSSTP
jgi:hypothetical protein